MLPEYRNHILHLLSRPLTPNDRNCHSFGQISGEKMRDASAAAADATLARHARGKCGPTNNISIGAVYFS